MFDFIFRRFTVKRLKKGSSNLNEMQELVRWFLPMFLGVIKDGMAARNFHPFRGCPGSYDKHPIWKSQMDWYTEACAWELIVTNTIPVGIAFTRHDQYYFEYYLGKPCKLSAEQTLKLYSHLDNLLGAVLKKFPFLKMDMDILYEASKHHLVLSPQ
jgi:hypothetical protein